MLASAWRVLLCLLLLVYAAPLLAQTKIANDPTRIGVGARTLGMGKSYVGLADDLTGIFINPAALSTIDQLQLTSLQGKFLNEYNYLNFGAALPTRFGSFGIGYVGSSIGFISPASTTEVVDGVRIIPSSTEGVSYNFLDSVLLLSWGKELFQLDAGATIKVFMLDLSGPGITQGQASGTELDLGLNYRVNSFLKTGLVVQNALPSSAGGKLHWQNGVEETLPSVWKVGLSLKILGDNGLVKLGINQVTFNLDGDFTPLRPNIPNLWHTGLEWSPVEAVFLRGGIDQDYVGSGTGSGLEPANNLTLGVGLLIGQYRFDYAYHQYNQVTDNDTHYFSLTYGVGKKEPVFQGPTFNLLPPDKTILFTREALVSGEVIDPRITSVFINKEEVIVADGVFSQQQQLKAGKNTITVLGFIKSKLSDQSRVRLLCLSAFRDVPPDYWARLPISILAMEGLLSGYPNGLFKPEGKITRAELIKLLINTMDIGKFSPAGKPYKDIPLNHWAARPIGFGAKKGYVRGFPGGLFKPNKPVTRAEGVSLISRFFQLSNVITREVPYSDLPGRHWATLDVIKAKAAGLLNYLAEKHFEPNRELTRAEVAEMLSRAPRVAPKIKSMLDWESGY